MKQVKGSRIKTFFKKAQDHGGFVRVAILEEPLAGLTADIFAYHKQTDSFLGIVELGRGFWSFQRNEIATMGLVKTK